MSVKPIDAWKTAGVVLDDQGVPLHFGDPQAEYTAARTGSALFDLTGRTQLELTGRDRAKFVHNFCTNEVRSLIAGQGCEAFVTNIQGKVLGHIFVFTAEKSLWIDSVPGAAATLLPHFTKYQIAEDVDFKDWSHDVGVFYVAGPGGADALSKCGISVTDLPHLGHRPGARPEIFAVRRLDLLGIAGWEIVLPSSAREQVWSQLTAAGVRPAGRTAFEPLRIEARTPLYGVDISMENLAQEVDRTSTAISFSKGCYLGQEPIARIDALGHVNQELRLLKLATGPVPAPGAEALTGDSRVIGRVTSAAQSYADGLPVALAYVRRSFNVSGMSVTVRAGEQTIPAVIQ